MKTKFIIILSLSFLCCTSCAKDKVQLDKENNLPVKPNKVCVMQFSIDDYTFEGGKELTFAHHDAFTLETTYKAPNDFGWIKLKYGELDESIFDASVIWMGNGKINYPVIDSAQTFDTINNPLTHPEDSLFLRISFGPGSQTSYNSDVDSQIIDGIWDFMEDLEVVSEYRASNPNGKIYLFPYYPDPLSVWNRKLIVIMKN